MKLWQRLCKDDNCYETRTISMTWWQLLWNYSSCCMIKHCETLEMRFAWFTRPCQGHFKALPRFFHVKNILSPNFRDSTFFLSQGYIWLSTFVLLRHAQRACKWLRCEWSGDSQGQMQGHVGRVPLGNSKVIVSLQGCCGIPRTPSLLPLLPRNFSGNSLQGILGWSSTWFEYSTWV